MGLGSGIQKKTIPDPGYKGQKGTGSRIRIRHTAKHTDFCKVRQITCQWKAAGTFL
jgi:hypothetical protein